MLFLTCWAIENVLIHLVEQRGVDPRRLQPGALRASSPAVDAVGVGSSASGVTLMGIQGGVAPTKIHQLVVSALLDDSSLMHHHDAVCVSDSA